jgi:dienelactone hydrolase
MRQNDAGYAIEKARQLTFVDGKNIFLVGLSQGGITTATFTAKNELQKVNARVVEGWTCHADWSEYAGINAPESEPVLTLVGSRDPWYQNPWTKGDCTEYLSKTNGSKSVVYRRRFLSTQHELLDFKKPKREVLKFLREQLIKNES